VVTLQVHINGNVFNYHSDFDPVNIHGNVQRSWKVSAGDYFKFPVKIGDTDCFVKRFSKKPEEISGYQFLQQIKGRKLPGLPVIYDIQETREAGKNVLYLFTEYIRGDTLDNLQRQGFSFLPMKLAEDLFLALQSIHENGFWFPDFDPKNFYKSETGSYYIIDLDSTYPLTAMPSNSMYGSKDYWSPVYEYYRSYLGFTPADIKTIRGDTLNNLQLVYFLGLYSFYLDGEGDDLTAHSISKLNDYLVKKHRLFASTLTYCCSKDGQNRGINQRRLNFQVFRNLVMAGLFQESIERSISNTPKNPEILFFKLNGRSVSSLSIKPGEQVVIEWSTRNATHIRLLPDNKLLGSEGTISLTPSNDTAYTLEAVHKHKKQSLQAKKTVAVSIYDPTRPVIQFSIKDNQHDGLFTEGVNYSLEWSTQNADEVFLDNMLVSNMGSKAFMANGNTSHILKAVNSRNGTFKTSQSTLHINTEKKPVFEFSASPASVKAGEVVTLSWKVAHGNNISIERDGKLIVQNKPPAGSVQVRLQLKEDKPSPQVSRFSAYALTQSGKSKYRHTQDAVVTIQKKGMSAELIAVIIGIAALLVGTVVVVMMNQNAGYTSSYQDQPYTADTTTTTVVTPDTVGYWNAPADSSATAVTEIDPGVYNFTDYFNNNYNDWPVKSDEDYEVSIQYGKLVIEGKSSDYTYYSNKNFPIDLSRDYEVLVKVQWQSGVQTHLMGLEFCSDYASGSFNVFHISANGQYGISYYENNEWKMITEWTESSLINTGSATNTLTIKKSSDVIRFYINDIFIKSLSTEGMCYGQGFGLRVGNVQTVEFDEFTLTGSTYNSDSTKK
jgi:hypothetical protein